MNLSRAPGNTVVAVGGGPGRSHGPSGGARSWRGPVLRLLAATTSANLADGLLLAGFPLLAVAGSHDPRLIAGLYVIGTLPWIVLALGVGILVDRLPRRGLLAASTGLRAPLAAALGVLALGGPVPAAVLLAVALALGCGEITTDSTAQALVPTLVDDDHLEVANGRLSAAEITANTFLGPALCGVLFAAAPSVPFLLAAALYVGSAGAAMRLPAAARGTREPVANPAPPAPAGAGRADLRGGLAVLAAQPALRAVLALTFMFALADTAGASVLVLLVVDEVGAGQVAFGVLLAVAGVGTALGSLGARRVSARVGLRGGLLLVAVALASGSAVVAAAPSVALVAVGLSVAGAAGGVWRVLTVALRQRVIPAELFGRVNSVFRAAAGAGILAGGALGAAVATRYGLRVAYVSGLPLLVVAVVALRTVRVPAAATSQ